MHIRHIVIGLPGSTIFIHIISWISRTHAELTTVSLNLQDQLYNIEKWLQKWKMKINETKSSHITFTLRKGQCPPVCINQTVILHVETVKYLGLHFDRRLTWKEHIATKRKQFVHKTREIKWLIGKNSPLSLENKILINKTVLRHVWTYGIELWGCANKSIIVIMQKYQSKLLRIITNAPWYVINHTLYTDLHIPYVRTVIHDRINKHRTTLASHPNPLMEPLLQTAHIRRLKRRWAFDQKDWGGIAGCLPTSPTTTPGHKLIGSNCIRLSDC
jgi:hypothetical protein